MHVVAPQQMLFQGNSLFLDSVERVLSNRDINFAKIRSKRLDPSQI